MVFPSETLYPWSVKKWVACLLTFGLLASAVPAQPVWANARAPRVTLGEFFCPQALASPMLEVRIPVDLRFAHPLTWQARIALSTFDLHKLREHEGKVSIEEKQRRIFLWRRLGLSDHQIGLLEYLSPTTVETYRTRSNTVDAGKDVKNIQKDLLESVRRPIAAAQQRLPGKKLSVSDDPLEKAQAQMLRSTTRWMITQQAVELLWLIFSLDFQSKYIFVAQAVGKSIPEIAAVLNTLPARIEVWLLIFEAKLQSHPHLHRLFKPSITLYPAYAVFRTAFFLAWDEIPGVIVKKGTRQQQVPVDEPSSAPSLFSEHLLDSTVKAHAQTTAKNPSLNDALNALFARGLSILESLDSGALLEKRWMLWLRDIEQLNAQLQSYSHPVLQSPVTILSYVFSSFVETRMSFLRYFQLLKNLERLPPDIADRIISFQLLQLVLHRDQDPFDLFAAQRLLLSALERLKSSQDPEAIARYRLVMVLLVYHRQFQSREIWDIIDRYGMRQNLLKWIDRYRQKSEPLTIHLEDLDLVLFGHGLVEFGGAAWEEAFGEFSELLMNDQGDKDEIQVRNRLQTISETLSRVNFSKSKKEGWESAIAWLGARPQRELHSPVPDQETLYRVLDFIEDHPEINRETIHWVQTTFTMPQFGVWVQPPDLDVNSLDAGQKSFLAMVEKLNISGHVLLEFDNYLAVKRYLRHELEAAA